MSGRKGGLNSSSDSNFKYNPPRRTVSMSRIYELAQPRRRYLEEALKKRKNLNNLPHDQRNNAMTTSMVVSGTPGVVPSNSNDPMIKSMYDLPSSARTPTSAGTVVRRSAPVRRPFTMSNSRSRNVLAQTPEIGELNLTSNNDHIPHSAGLVKSRSTATFRTGASSNIESNSESAASGISKSSSVRPKKGITKRREQQKEYENRRKEKEEREEELKMKQAEREASEKIKRAKEERRKREAEEEAARVKAQQELAEKLAREEEERLRLEEEEATKLANELKKEQEEKLLQAMEEHKRRQEEERKRQEEEARLTQEREEAEARLREEAERARIEREEKLRKDEEERQERKKVSPWSSHSSCIS